MDFNVVSGFEVSLEVELTLVLVNKKGLGEGGGGGRGAEIDSNRSFAVISSLSLSYVLNIGWSPLNPILILTSHA